MLRSIVFGTLLVVQAVFEGLVMILAIFLGIAPRD